MEWGTILIKKNRIKWNEMKCYNDWKAITINGKDEILKLLTIHEVTWMIMLIKLVGNFFMVYNVAFIRITVCKIFTFILLHALTFPVFLFKSQFVAVQISFCSQIYTDIERSRKNFWFYLVWKFPKYFDMGWSCFGCGYISLFVLFVEL